MIKKLSKHGNSYALVIEKPILDLLGIGPDTELKIETIDGKSLTISPAGEKEERMKAARKRINEKYDRELDLLAQ